MMKKGTNSFEKVERLQRWKRLVEGGGGGEGRGSTLKKGELEKFYPF